MLRQHNVQIAGLAAGLPPAVNYIENKGSTGSKKVLVTYTSKAGSTGEVAAAISEVLKSKGLSVDTLLISAFLVTAVVLILSVYLRRQDMKGRHDFVATVDRYVITFYPLAYIVTIVAVTMLFR